MGTFPTEEKKAPKKALGTCILVSSGYSYVWE